LFPHPPVIDFVPERDECQCGQRLKVQKTRRKTVQTMTGPIIAREKVLECQPCSRVFTADALLRLVQNRCTVAYEVEASVQRVTALMAAEINLSPALKAAIDVLLLLVMVLVNRLGLNSKNSSKPPSTDPYRRKNLKPPGDRKPGGQPGHRGTTLQPLANPNAVKPIPVDRTTLPQGTYRDVGYEARQVIDLEISANADETGINIGGKLAWLHTLATEEFTYYYPHAKRGSDAMDDMGVLPQYQGTICHDHWQPYFKYGRAHALCNAHHLRELERAFEQDGQQWAQVMAGLLTEINTATTAAGGCLDEARAEQYRQYYREVIRDAEKECPPPEEKERTGKRCKIARSKARNLLERQGIHVLYLPTHCATLWTFLWTYR